MATNTDKISELEKQVAYLQTEVKLHFQRIEQLDTAIQVARTEDGRLRDELLKLREQTYAETTKLAEQVQTLAVSVAVLHNGDGGFEEEP